MIFFILFILFFLPILKKDILIYFLFYLSLYFISFCLVLFYNST